MARMKCVSIYYLMIALVAQLFLIQPSAAMGRTIVVTGSIQAAVDAAQPGDILQLGAHAYAEKVELGAAGTVAAPIVLKGAGQGQTILNGRIRMLGTAQFWRLEDFAIDPTDSGDAIRIETPAHDVLIDRMQLSGGSGYGIRISNDVSHVVIQQSNIHHFDAGSADAHGIGIMTANDITVRDCIIYANSGDAIQVNTPDYPGYGRFASAILIEHNQLYGNRENALDIKSTHGLVARGNEMWGARAVSTSDGMAIQVQYDAQDITISKNIIRDSDMGLEISRGKKNGTIYPLAPTNIVVIGNLFYGIGTPAAPVLAASPVVAGPQVVFLPLIRMQPSASGSSGGGSARAAGNAIVVLTSSDVKIYNNTVIDAIATALYLGESATSGPPSNVVIRNNVLDGRVSDLGAGIDYSAIGGLIVSYNHYRTGRVGGASLTSWIARGYEQHATSGDPLLDGNRLPVAGSPLHDSGVNVGYPFVGSAPDRGWGE